MALDLADQRDRARAVTLASRADVVIENYRPGSLARFGLDYASVAARNPRAVYCSITGFGAAQGSDRPGYDFLVQAVGGLMSVTGDADGEPMKVGVAVVDVLTGKDAVIGILAALTARAQTGRGQHVQVELLSSLLSGLVNQAAGYLTTGVSPGRMGNAHPSVVPYQTVRCADGPLAVACGNDGQFARLVSVLGLPELASDPRFVHNGDRVNHRTELIPALEKRTVAFSAGDLEELLTAAGVPAGLVGDVGSAIDRAEACGLSPLVEVGDGRQVRHPVRYSASEVAEAVAPPAVGEHDDLLQAWLDGPGSAPLPRRAP